MTSRLQQAFDEAAKLPVAEQELLASRLLAELAAEDDFDRKIARTSNQLVRFAHEAIEEHRAGLTKTLDADAL